MAQETPTVSSSNGQEGMVEVVGEPNVLCNDPVAAVAPVLAPDESPAEALVESAGESPTNDVVEGFESTTSSFMENVNSFCLTQSRADPPPTPEESHLLEFNSTTSSYLANINSYCDAVQLSTELSSALNSSDMPAVEPPFVCRAEWLTGKHKLSILSRMSDVGGTQGSQNAVNEAIDLGESEFDNFNACISSYLPGCACLMDELCVACVKHENIGHEPAAHPMLHGLWDHLVAISRTSFARLPKRKAGEAPTTTRRPDPPLSPESLSKEFKKMKLLENQDISTPGPSVPHTGVPSVNGVFLSSQNLSLPDSLLQEHGVSRQ